MSAQSEATTKALNAARSYAGEFITYLGKQYACRTTETTGSKAGEHGIPKGDYGPFIASDTPRVFEFAPDAFSGVALPQESSIFIRNGLQYIVTAADFVNEGTETVCFYCYALRYIWHEPTV